MLITVVAKEDLLLVDASQGVEAQTLANAQLADSQGLEVIPVINKIDLPSADVDRVSKQIEDILAIPAEDAILASGKSGIGVDEILEAVVTRLPSPRWIDHPKPRALIFDSQFDPFKGVICYVRIFFQFNRIYFIGSCSHSSYYGRSLIHI